MTTAPAFRARRRAALLTAAFAVMGLSACSLTSPAATLLRYAPADGIELDGDAIDVRDLLVVSQGDGAPGVVLGSVFNQSTEPITLTVRAGGTALSPQLEVAPGSFVRLDGTGASSDEGEDQSEPVTIPVLATPAGQSVEIAVSTGQETLSGNVPVLLPRDHYEQFADDAGGTVEPSADEDEDH